MASTLFTSSAEPQAAAEAELAARAFMALTGYQDADPEALGLAVFRLKSALKPLEPIGGWDDSGERLNYGAARNRAQAAFPYLGLYAAPDPQTIDGEPSIQDAIDDLAILIQEIGAALSLVDGKRPAAGLDALVSGYHERWRGHLEGLTFAIETRDGLA